MILLFIRISLKMRNAIHHIYSPRPERLLWTWRMGQIEQEVDAFIQVVLKSRA